MPGSREGEDKEFNGSMYGPCISALWNKSGPNPDTVNSRGPKEISCDGSFSDGYNNSGNDYSY